ARAASAAEATGCSHLRRYARLGLSEEKHERQRSSDLQRQRKKGTGQPDFSVSPGTGAVAERRQRKSPIGVADRPQEKSSERRGSEDPGSDRQHRLSLPN